MELQALTYRWLGRRVRYGSYATAEITRAMLCEDRAGMPYVGFEVKHADGRVSVWPAVWCEVMEES